MSVVNDIHKFAWLREERSDLSIIPTSQDAFSVIHESNTIAFKVGDLNSQELLAILSIPDSNVIDRAGRKDIWVVTIGEKVIIMINSKFKILLWEGNIVNFLMMAGVSQLSNEFISINPVNVRLISSTEEMCVISSESDWCYSS